MRDKTDKRGKKLIVFLCFIWFKPGLHQAAVEGGDLLDGGVAGIARAAGVREGALGEELHVLVLDDLLEVGGDAHVGAQLLDGGDGGLGGVLVVHAVDVGDLHGLANGAVALAGDGHVVLKAERQQDRAGDAVGRVIQGGQAVGHGVDDAEADVREAHTGDVLAESHALAAGLVVLHGGAQVLRDQADGLEMEHVGDGAVTLGDVALDGVGQSVHAGGGGEGLGHGVHHLGIDHGDLGDVVHVHADELFLLRKNVGCSSTFRLRCSNIYYRTAPC